jgi:hypothetical protein
MGGSQEAVIPQAPVPFCWASCLGDCSSDFSREHIISKATIPGPQISVEGFPFQRGEVITLHKQRFSANILCRYHNNLLSSVDQAGTSGFDAFRDAASDEPRRKNTIRGPMFERWLLKTFINIELLSHFGTRIPAELVEIAFGRRPFPPGSGLFFVTNGQDAVIPEDRITMVRLHDPEKNDAVPGAQFTIGGFHLLLALGPFPTDNRPIKFENKDGSIEHVRLMHHPARFNFTSGNTLTIDWRQHINTKLKKRRHK